MELTQSLEDYLEAILIEASKKPVVRIKDIGRRLKVATASVVGAIKNLQNKGLVVHKRYGYIELTQKGKELAREVYERRKVLYKFFTEVLGISPKTAEKDACGIEHYISKEGFKKLLAFIQFATECPEGEPLWLSNFHYYLKTGKRPKQCIEHGGNMEKLLSDVKPKQKVKILRITGKGVIKRKLLDMGVMPGEEIEVIRVAPLGDPIEIRVKGYNLSLRKIEAEGIVVEEASK